MLEQILRYCFGVRCYNWPIMAPGGINHGAYVIKNGSITLPFLQNGQYFRIIGSVFNDGVYKYDDELKLTDETFDGTIWALAIPKGLLKLVEEIETWTEVNSEKLNSPFQSESFGGYSYTLKSGNSDGGSGGGLTWQSAFSARLNQWRKI